MSKKAPQNQPDVHAEGVVVYKACGKVSDEQVHGEILEGGNRLLIERLAIDRAISKGYSISDAVKFYGSKNLNKNNYRERLLEHLCLYKKHILQINEKGKFQHKGRELFFDHILPKENDGKWRGGEWSNIIEPYRDKIRLYMMRNGIKTHRYFHHLNSSQAFAFNLFFPYFSEPANSKILLRALGQEESVLADSWGFEMVPVPEENTNVDVHWRSQSGIVTFCEVKLTEAEFGKAKNDERHKLKLKNIYRPVLLGKVDEKLLNEEDFFSYYQILRNVWHLAKVENSRLIFLLPRDNKKLWQTIEEVMPKIENCLSSRISICSVEDVINNILRDSNCPAELHSHAGKLREKYLLAD